MTVQVISFHEKNFSSSFEKFIRQLQNFPRDPTRGAHKGATRLRLVPPLERKTFYPCPQILGKLSKAPLQSLAALAPYGRKIPREITDEKFPSPLPKGNSLSLVSLWRETDNDKQ